MCVRCGGGDDEDLAKNRGVVHARVPAHVVGHAVDELDVLRALGVAVAGAIFCARGVA